MFNSTRITKLEQQINSIVDLVWSFKGNVNSTQSTTEKLIDVLMEKSKVKIYKVSDVIDTGTPYSLSWLLGYNGSCTSGSRFDTISTEKLQTIGKYEIFKDGEDTYAIVKNYKKTNKK